MSTSSGAPSPAAIATAVPQCGSQAGGKLCHNCLCCSRFGFCGDTDPYCGAGCVTPPGPRPVPGDVASVVPRDLFERLLLHRNDAACPARGFYTYDAFIAAAAAFPGFGTTGSDEQRKREVAAFLGQTSHGTTGGWATAPDGPFSWGYNYNYGPAGRVIGVDLLNNPDLEATDAVVSFKMALWFWMTPRDNKPSCHAVITGQWTPTDADRAAGRGAPGYGVITNIINGGLECGRGPDLRVADRIGFYKRYCHAFRIGYGSDLDCDGQRPFNAAVAAGLAAQ
uniref:chitinase n=1 Tax=Setaria italica TaxID=4555 RepID=K3ZBX5_SETIT